MEAGAQHTAINLSTVKDGKENILNGDFQKICENGESSPGEQIEVFRSNIPSSNTNSNTGAIKRKPNMLNGNGMDQCLSAGTTVQQPLQVMATRHGLSPQQIHQLLQQQQHPALSSQHLEQMMQQQATVMQHQQQQKIQDQVLQQLNEQLQVNIIQQSQLMQQPSPDKIKVTSKQVQQQLQQLALQQQQLVQQIQQIQLQQRQHLLACLVQPFGVPQGMMMSPAEIQQLWKEVSSSQSGVEDMLKTVNGVSLASTRSTIVPGPNFSYGANGVLDGYLLPSSLVSQPPLGIKVDDSPTNPLYRHGMCKWPDCDTAFDSYTFFLKHLNAEHQLDDRSTAQTRVQIQLVSQLEIHLAKEKEVLQAMMQHLHMNQQKSPAVQESFIKTEPNTRTASVTAVTPMSPVKLQTPVSVSLPTSPGSLVASAPSVAMAAHPPPLIIPTTPTTPSLALHHISISQPVTPMSQPSSKPPTPTSAGPMRRRVSDKCNLPISAEIQRNREFYKNTGVRPPFTYASLIRQAVIESPHKQLTLNEIYQWFQNTFAYFRRNEATWKNAVRHNLSLHKCFMRVENVKGAVWTVDEVEFYKRRPQKLSGALSLKSPTMGSEAAFFGDNLNVSLRVAMEQSNMALMTQHMSNGSSLDMDGAEDLSMKNSYSDMVSRQLSPSTREEILLAIKQESGLECGSEVVREEVISNGCLIDESRGSSNEEAEAMDMTTACLSPLRESKTMAMTDQSESLRINIPANQELYTSALLDNRAVTHSIAS